MRDHEAHTASLRANCHHLQERVSTNQKNLVKVNQGISDMQVSVMQVVSEVYCKEMFCD